jgi:hypothetical protein
MIAAILPCRGRAEQTVRNVRRLLATAGDVEWRLYLVGSREDILPINGLSDYASLMSVQGNRLTYWEALKLMTDEIDRTQQHLRTAPIDLIANLANDLLPGQHWLARAASAYRETFGDGPGMVGFNDGHHETGHSCHFLISRSLLDRYGGWPTWYDHNFGDTELCQRAIADGLYVKAPWATLFHDHPYFGGDDDGVYAEGRAKSDHDYQLYEQRRRQGWPTISR